ncbi:SIR2-like domain-containing protein, partial [Hypoxylon sp. FL0543]
MNALQYIEDQASGIAHANRRDLDVAKTLLRAADVTEHDLFDAINRVTLVMKKRTDLYSGWLRHAFDGLYDVCVDQGNMELLDSLRQLQRKGAMLLTTNYDDLLEKHCGLPALSASETDRLYSFQRRSFNAVFHPHGHWQDSDNVVLSAEHYYDVTKHEEVQETLRHILSTRTVLFVGCGGGLEDPNVGPLLRWIGEKHASRGAGHYLLLSRDTPNPVPSLSLNHVICESRADIAPWLMRLLEPSERREGVVHEFPNNRQRINISNWLSPVDQTWFLSDVSELATRAAVPFHQEVTGEQSIWDIPGTFFWVTGQEGWGKTVFCSSVIDSTRQMCRRRSAQPPRSRDSLAYFFCTTYDVHERASPLRQHDFSDFACTVLEQLCPPKKIHEALRQLYTRCTQYHPARRPTHAELQDALITVIDSLDREVVKPGQDNIQPGETYLILDGLDGVSRSYRDPFVSFLREIKSRNFQHFHLLLGSRYLHYIRNMPGQQWEEFVCNHISVHDTIEGYLLHRIYNEPDFWGTDREPGDAERALVVNRLLTLPQNSFRNLYWKMEALRDLESFNVDIANAILDAPFEDDDQRERKRARI